LEYFLLKKREEEKNKKRNKILSKNNLHDIGTIYTFVENNDVKQLY